MPPTRLDVVHAELLEGDDVGVQGCSCAIVGADACEAARAVKHCGLTHRSRDEYAAAVSRRTVFFVSDQTGVTAETLGHSLMTQFEGLEFRAVTLPFVSSLDKAHEVVRRINRAGEEAGAAPDRVQHAGAG